MQFTIALVRMIKDIEISFIIKDGQALAIINAWAQRNYDQMESVSKKFLQIMAR